ncbi:hypothetical protein Tco_1083737 [Tanacetum coccineum]
MRQRRKENCYDEMLRQRCTSGDEHQYHIDQMKNFLKSDIVWESRKEILASLHPRNNTPLVQSCQRDPEAPALSLIIMIIFWYYEERSSGLRNSCVKKFNPYARYGVEHWNNPHAKIFYIKMQKEPGKPKEVVYSNSKIIQVIKTYCELGREHKFITEIVARRANECIVSITEPDYKNLNKNAIEDMYLLIMNGMVPDYAEIGLMWSLSVLIRSSVIWERVHDFQLGIESYQQKVNLTAPTISFPGIKKHKIFSIIYEPVHGIKYKNGKKEKRVMRHSEIHKFCDATLNRVLEGLKSYNNDVKYDYIQRDLIEDEVEYLKLFAEEIGVSQPDEKMGDVLAGDGVAKPCDDVGAYKRRHQNVTASKETLKDSTKQRTAKMAQMSDLFPELYTIITFLVISSGDIRDWPTVSATCRKFKDVATKPNILRAVKFQDLIEIGHPEQHLHINGLLNRGVQAGNMNAEYTMAKIILDGEAPL